VKTEISCISLNIGPCRLANTPAGQRGEKGNPTVKIETRKAGLNGSVARCVAVSATDLYLRSSINKT
jgi:hypothetical protein